MINLREKYADVIEAMKVDARANIVEATKLKNEREETVENCLTTVTDLQNTADSAKSQFSQASRALRKMGHSSSPNPDMVETATEPFGIYAEAARKLPQSRVDLAAAKEELDSAEWTLAKAQKELQIISSL